MDKSDFRVLIVGLGLIGGSLAKALRGFRNCRIFGVDTNQAVLVQAEKEQVIEKGYLDANEIVAECDLVILCVHPHLTRRFLEELPFKADTLVTDVCGVKQYMQVDKSERNFRYIGGHPMAGKEAGGYENSVETLFFGASYLLTPDADANEEDIRLLREMAKHIGCRKTVICPSKEHDAMIAYTSQLMHVVAAALCDNPLLDEAEGYSAGSLRDCTRVAKLDASLWTELFFANKEELIARINEFEDSMDKVKNALSADDRKSLHTFLERSTERKRRYLSEDLTSKPDRS